MSNPVVQIQPASANFLAPIAGFEDMQITPSILKLVQNTTRDEGAVKGKLFDTVGKSNHDSMRVVPLAIKATRVYFPPGGDLGVEPLCRSNNGVVPAPDAQVPQCTTCELCDHGAKMWKDFKRTGQKPDCQEKFRLLVVSRDSGLPYWLTVGGKTVSRVKDLKKGLHRNILELRMKNENRNIYDFSFEIKPVEVKGRKGSYYELSFINIERISNIGEFGILYEAFVRKQTELEAQVEQSEAVDAEISDDAAAVEV